MKLSAKAIAFVMVTVLLVIVGCSKPAPTPAKPPSPSPTAAPAPSPSPVVTPSPSPKPAPAPTAAPAKIVWKAVSMYPLSSPVMQAYKKLMDEIAKRAGGQLVIAYKGGPEVIPEVNQIKAMQSSVIDITSISAANFDAQVPETRVMPLSPLTYAEERKAGFLDFMRKTFADKAGTYWLMNANKSTTYFLALNVPVNRPQELKGLKFRSHAIFQPWLDALGIKGVFMPAGDVYNAMKLKNIDGYPWNPPAVVEASMYEVTKYWIDHYVWSGGGVAIVINLNSWKSLPKNLQDLIEQIVIELEPQTAKEIDDLNKKAGKVFADKGMKAITFSPEDLKYYTDAANNAKWAQVEQGIAPPVLNQIKAMFKK